MRDQEQKVKQCSDIEYCRNHREGLKKKLESGGSSVENGDVVFTTEQGQVTVTDSEIVAHLSLQTVVDPTQFISENLDLHLEFYQQGIMRINIVDPTENVDRFRISDTGVGVEWDQLTKVTNLTNFVT